jgi:hypothetical protein
MESSNEPPPARAAFADDDLLADEPADQSHPRWTDATFSEREWNKACQRLSQTPALN